MALAVPAVLAFALGPAASQALITDRPDQTESSTIVPPDRVQIEAGWTLARSDAGSDTGEAGSSLVRVGIDRRWELRLGWGGFVTTDADTGGPEDEGPADTSIGAKLDIGGEHGARPETALILAATLPTGRDRVSSERVDPQFRFACSHTLSERVGLGYNLGAGWVSGRDGGGERHTLSRLVYTAAVGFDLAPRVGLFVEAFGDAGGSAGGPPAHALDGGLTWLVRGPLQLDLAGGVGLTDAAEEWFVGAGVSARLPR